MGEVTFRGRALKFASSTTQHVFQPNKIEITVAYEEGYQRRYGLSYQHEVKPRLLHYLRDVIGLFGTRIGREASVCKVLV